MAIVGFSFSKILVEKKEKAPLKTEIKSKIHITNISKDDVKLVQGKDVLRFGFEFGIEYLPNLAKIEFEGHLLLVAEPKEADEIIKKWKAGNKLDDDIRLRVYNTIFNKCNVKAFELEEDFNLPLHLRLPQIAKDAAKEAKK